MLALVGAFNVVEGLVAIYDGRLVRVDRDLVLFVDLAGWAQITLTLGALLLALGIWLSVVTVRVRLVALSVVLVHALTQLGVLTAFPAWALLMISFDVVIIFALTATPDGAAASVAREIAGTVPPAARTGATRGPAAAMSGRRAGYLAGDRIYRPRHQVAGAAATVVLGPPLVDAVGTAPEPATANTGALAVVPRALPAASAAGGKPDTKAPTTATMPGPVARSATGTATPPTPGTARGVAAPIIGAISGKWPDANQHG
jgi:hypothetical protein